MVNHTFVELNNPMDAAASAQVPSHLVGSRGRSATPKARRRGPSTSGAGTAPSGAFDPAVAEMEMKSFVDERAELLQSMRRQLELDNEARANVEEHLEQVRLFKVELEKSRLHARMQSEQLDKLNGNIVALEARLGEVHSGVTTSVDPMDGGVFGQ